MADCPPHEQIATEAAAEPTVPVLDPPRKGEVALQFAYRSQSPAFVEVLLDEGDVGRVSWLRKSALVGWEVNDATHVVDVVMPRGLALRRNS